MIEQEPSGVTCVFSVIKIHFALPGEDGGGERAATDVYSCAEVATCSVFEVLGGLSTDGSALFFSKQYFKCVCK